MKNQVISNHATVTIPARVLSTLSFMSEILGDYDTYSDGMITWAANHEEQYFASLCWDADAPYVEIMDGVEPRVASDKGANLIYTIFGYCRYQGIYHRLLGATLPTCEEKLS